MTLLYACQRIQVFTADWNVFVLAYTQALLHGKGPASQLLATRLSLHNSSRCYDNRPNAQVSALQPTLFVDASYMYMCIV